MTPIQKLIETEIEKLEMAMNVLSFSHEQVLHFSNVSTLTNEPLVLVEAYTSRFSRLADIFLQSTLKTIDEADLENEGSVRDRINRAEKKGIIQSATIQITIRNLRNKIAHEYVFANLQSIFEKTKTFTPMLIYDVKMGIEYLKRYLNT